ncbi:hypothetical protein [Nostoc sp. UHCC 0252]|uniref:hypothetical protein n=1 Tax=Nostoc sp. UHCC 0252 TaxID=3110241 RepID=UPI002B1F0949|nr:hypothetical protein [Nostoc sp. UHCC 0252]MEA5604320.1 hypothetical protein [Nostoc sp. UHCC 0252]
MPYDYRAAVQQSYIPSISIKVKVRFWAVKLIPNLWYKGGKAMTQSFMLTQETISTLQAQVTLFEQHLHFSNAQNEADAELIKLANSRQISLAELNQEMVQLSQNLHTLVKLLKKIIEGANGGQVVLYFVKSNFLLKEILDDGYWDFYCGENAKKAFELLTSGSIALYKEIKNVVSPETPKKDINYVVLETLKHSLNSMIAAGLRVSAFSQEEVSAFDLGDITPQESETVLIFLSTMKKWEPVYKRLAAS